MMTLLEIVGLLNTFDEEDTIYAAPPWGHNTPAIVTREDKWMRDETLNKAFSYFLEISVAREFIADWVASKRVGPTAEEQCQRLIDYAINDA